METVSPSSLTSPRRLGTFLYFPSLFDHPRLCTRYQHPDTRPVPLNEPFSGPERPSGLPFTDSVWVPSRYPWTPNDLTTLLILPRRQGVNLLLPPLVRGSQCVVRVLSVPYFDSLFRVELSCRS